MMQARNIIDKLRFPRWFLLTWLVFGVYLPAVNALEITGEVTWLHRVELGTPVKGIVQQVNVSSGAMVKKGEVLLQLDQRGFQAKVRALQARLSNQKAEFAEAGRERDRALELYDRTVLSEHDLQIAKNKYIAAQADFKQTKAELVLAKLDLEHSSIRAPFDGVVVARHAEVGESIIPVMKPVVSFVLADPQRLKAVSYLKLEQLDGIKPGMEVKLKARQGEFKGRVSAVAVEPERTTSAGEKRYRVSVEFDTRGEVLRIGSPITLSLP